MKIVSTNVFVGPNVWAGFPVIRHVVDLGVLEDWPSAKIGDQWIEALVEALPGLHEHGCSYRETGGLIRRLREGRGDLAWPCGRTCGAGNPGRPPGSDVTFGRTRGTGVPGHYNLVYEYRQRDVGLEAGATGDPAFDASSAREREKAYRLRL